MSTLENAKERFITQWGALGSAWGINRTMAQIHALLLVSPEPLSTDEIMNTLAVSRGNANTNLRELISWGIVHKVLRKGERKEYFLAEKDVWQIFCLVAKERGRREIDPALLVLKECAANTKGVRESEGKVFHQQMVELANFIELASSLSKRIAAAEQSKIIPAILKLFK